MTKGQVRKLWEEFSSKVMDDVPKDSVQYRECRRVFYSACLRTVIYMRDEIAEMPDMAAISSMKNMVDEVYQFYKDEINRNHDIN